LDETVHLKHLRDLAIADEYDKGKYLHAASGIALCGDNLHIICDDSFFLATFDLGSGEPGRLTRLLQRADLPADPVARKRLKPDFEVIITLPACKDLPHGGLLAMGSGSTPLRGAGAVVTLDAGGKAATVAPVDLERPLFAVLRAAFKELNIEGGVFAGSRLHLFQRGNAGDPASAVVTFEIGDLPAALAENRPVGIPEIRVIDLGSIDGIPFGFTDAAALDGEILFIAAAERTSNAYDDGEIFGSMLGLLSPQLELTKRWRLEPRLKFEGITARRSPDGIKLLVVTDTDDPQKPSSLFLGQISFKS
jgi:hypothetical protein